jgi:hypothetical protein
MEVEEKRMQRLQFLHELYRITDGNENAFADMWMIGEGYRFEKDTTIKITHYLQGEGLLKFQALGGLIGITHRGVLEVEKALTNQDEPTEHFPPAKTVNIIHVNQMTHSQIQQDTSDSNQMYTLNDTDLQGLRDIIRGLKETCAQPSIPTPQKADLGAEIKTIEGQLSSSKPKTAIIKESLSSAMNILENVSSICASAVPLIYKISSWISGS